jgi:hypothetical protein
MASPPSAPLRAGAAQVEITPRAGTHLSGAEDRFNPAQSVLDPLYAKAVVLERGERRLAFVALDVTVITAEYTARLRQAAQGLGFPPEAVMVHATHTHSAPSLGHHMLDPDFPALPAELEWFRGCQRAAADLALAQAIQALEQAAASLQPVQIAAGSAIRDGLAFNRRGVTRDGSVIMPWLFSGLQQPLGPTGIRYLEGPSDPEVGVVCLRNSALKMVAMLLHFTCHPVNVHDKPTVSADWPGAWAADLQEIYGEQCVGLVLNGACGNLNPWPPFEPDFVRDHRRMGRALTESTLRIMDTLTFAEDAALDFRRAILPLPVREIPEAELEPARRLLEQHPQPIWSRSAPGTIAPEWFRASSLWSLELLRRRQPELPCEIQAFRVGDIAFAGLPGEPFVEGQLALKIASPAYPTYVASCCTDYAGYIPTREAFTRGGHEVNPSYWSKLVPGALETLVERATAMLQEMF